MWFGKKTPKEKTPDFYTYPHGHIWSHGVKIPISRKSICEATVLKFRAKALMLAEDVVNAEWLEQEDLEKHFKRCQYGDPDLTAMAEVAQITAKDKKDLLEKVRKYLK